MATFKEEDHTAVSGSDQELPAQKEEEVEEEEEEEGAVGEQSPERRHDTLIDISEEDFMKELEPFEYHCYSGWEEAVHGWARVAPMSCLLLSQKKNMKPKQKEADNLTPVSVDPAIADAASSASIAAELCSESHVHPHNSLKKSIPLDQHTGSCSDTAVAAEWPALNAMQITTLKDETLSETPMQPHYHPLKHWDNKPTKPQKHRPSSTVVPITNFHFFPPIQSPQLNHLKATSQLCSCKKPPELEGTEENCFMFDKKSRTRGTRADRITNQQFPTSSAAQTSKYRTCPHNSHLFSAESVSLPRTYPLKPGTVHHTSYTVDKSLTQGPHPSTAAGAKAHMYPSKTVCM